MQPAVKAWIMLAIYVIVVDTVLIVGEQKGREDFFTMSTAFENALRHPVKRWPVILLWGFLTLHLFDIILPENVKRYEPVTLVGRKISEFLV